ncbi:hypothetical protein G6F24_017521 [Rhizopus arrhizus]|nr:hypothetical protein G6F24_017521 [Rhizopus arrhizus]
MHPAYGGLHVAACLQQRQHGVRRFHGVRLVRRRDTEQLLPVAQRLVAVAQLARRHRGDPDDLRRLDLIAQQAGRQRVRHVVASQFELIAHQDLLGLAAGSQGAIGAAQKRQ